MTRTIDLNADLGEGIGTDADLLGIVTSASIACGGHAGDAETMVDTLALAKMSGVTCGAHPGYPDRENFGRRVIPMTPRGIERMVATQIGALMGAAAQEGITLRHVKAHGALANLAADDPGVALAIARATAAMSRDLVLLAISGTAQEAAAEACGLRVAREVFADRAYLPTGRLVPRGQPRAMIDDPQVASERMVTFLDTGLMPTLDGPPVRLSADSICVHGDGPGAVVMAQALRDALAEAGIALAPFT